MNIGIPKERRSFEFRVGLPPAGVEILKQHGHAIFVEHEAGVGAGFSDEEVLGLIVAKFCRWDFDKIKTVCADAMEDANFRSESAAVREMADGGEIKSEQELVNLFGDHYGHSFWLLKTPITPDNTSQIHALVEDGSLSPSEIDDRVKSRTLADGGELSDDYKFPDPNKPHSKLVKVYANYSETIAGGHAHEIYIPAHEWKNYQRQYEWHPK